MSQQADLFPYEHGITWVMREWMRRGSHAVVVNDSVYLIDPVDVPEAIEAAQALGPIAGVFQLLDRHPRACKALADRFGVPLHRLPDASPVDGIEVLSVLRKQAWQERALWIPSTQTLVVAELVGTNDYYALAKNPLGVHPGLRMTKLAIGRDLPIEHLLVGHGAPLHGADVPEALQVAYANRRRDLLLMGKGLRAFVGTKSPQ